MAEATATATARDGRLTIMGSAGIREVSTTSSWKGDVVFRLIIFRNLRGQKVNGQGCCSKDIIDLAETRCGESSSAKTTYKHLILYCADSWR